MSENEFTSLHLSSHRDHCPYCNACIEIVLDPFQAGMSYVEDCSVCCQPMIIHCWVTSHGKLTAELHAE